MKPSREPLDARVRELEIKVMFLEKHLEEQDRAMLEHYRQIERLQRETQGLAQRLAYLQSAREETSTPFPENEKPPHY